MEGFDLLGAVEALSTQYITLRVKSIDAEKLKAKLGGSSGQLASFGLSLVDRAPKAALDVAMPFVKKEALDYGVDLEVQMGNAPLAKQRAMSEFWPGLVAGTVLGGSALVISKLIMKLVGR